MWLNNQPFAARIFVQMISWESDSLWLIIKTSDQKIKMNIYKEKDCGFLGLLCLGDKLNGILGTPIINFSNWSFISQNSFYLPYSPLSKSESLLSSPISCQYCGKFWWGICTVCLTVARKEHLETHYYPQEHGIKAASNKNSYEWKKSV